MAINTYTTGALNLLEHYANYTVIATSCAGRSIASSPVMFTAPTPALPSAPSILNISSTHDSVTSCTGTITLTWLAVASDRAVTSYEILLNGTTVVGYTSTTTFTTGTLNLIEHYATYTVRATNCVGSGMLSSAVMFTPLTPAPPSAASISIYTTYASATSCTGNITLTWPAVTSDENVTSYEVLLNGSNIATLSPTAGTKTYTSSMSLATFNGRYTVRAVSCAGSSVSNEVVFTPPTLPSAPTNLSLSAYLSPTICTGNITLTWLAVTSYRAVTSYEVFLNGTTVVGYTSTATFTTGILNLIEHYATYTVRATSCVGSGVLSSPVIFIPLPPPVLPSAPTSLSLSAYLLPTSCTGNITLTWAAVTSDGTITSYEVLLNGSTMVGYTNTTTYTTGTLKLLEHYATYTVRAINCVGSGVPSSPVMFTPLTPGVDYCNCKIGYSGNGTICGVDTDGDSFPDDALPCQQRSCIKDNCPNTYNPSQTDCNNDHIGDSCQIICKSVTDPISGIVWPCIEAGKSVSLPCTFNNESNAIRECMSNGIYSSYINTLACTSPAYVQITSGDKENQLIELRDTIIAVSPKFSGDLNISLNVLTTFSNETAKNFSNTSQVMNIIIDTLSIINEIIRIENIPLLGLTETSFPVAETLIEIVETHAEQIISNLATNITVDFLENIYFSTTVIPLTDSSGSVSLNTRLQGDAQSSPTVSQIDIQLDSSTINASQIGIALFSKKNIDKIFIPSTNIQFGSRNIDISHFDINKVVTVSSLFSAQVYVANKKKTQFENPIRITLPIDLISHSENEYSRYSCGYLTQNVQDTVGYSTWTDIGVTDDTSNMQDRGQVSCITNHLTSFSVLVAVHGVDETHFSISIVSNIGIGISIACLLMAIIIYLLFGRDLLKQFHHFIHINLIIAMLFLYISFTFIEAGYIWDPSITCRIISGIIQYCLLAVFMWTFYEGLHMFLLMAFPFYKWDWKYFLLFACVGWILPLVYVGIFASFLWPNFVTHLSTFTKTREIYITNSTTSGICWPKLSLTIDNIYPSLVHTMFLFVPTLFVLLANCCSLLFTVFRFLMIVVKQRSLSKLQRLQKVSLRVMRLFMVLYPVLGFSWFIGILNFTHKSKVFDWLFAVSQTLQGILLLTLTVLIRKDIRNTIMKKCAIVMPFLRSFFVERSTTKST